MPTRLPYGLSFIKPALVGANTAQFTFTAGDTSPDVSLGTIFYTSNSAVSIDTFDGGEQGKVLIVYDAVGSLTITTGGNITLAPRIAVQPGTLAANTATGVITGSGTVSYVAASSLTLSSGQTVFFHFTDSVNAVQINSFK